jgi:hypothetical protein
MGNRKSPGDPLRDVRGCPNAGARPRIITTSLAPLRSEMPDAAASRSDEAATWQRVANLVRTGAALIALVGLVKASGILAKGVSFVMLLVYYLTY